MTSDDVTDSTCSECRNKVVLFVHEITVVTHPTVDRYHYECPLCGKFNDHWLGTHTRAWLLSRGAAVITVDYSPELLDVARDRGPWTVDDLAEYRRLYGDPPRPMKPASTEDIWRELEAAT